MKAFFIFIVIGCMTSAANAEGLLFGALHAEDVNGKHCYTDLTVPKLFAEDSAELPAGLEQLNQTWMDVLTAQWNEYQETINSPHSCQDYFDSFQSSIDFSIKTSLHSKVTSIQLHYFWFTGGAHGNGGSEEYNFVSATGEQILTLGDVFKEESYDAVMALIEEKLLEKGIDLTFGWNHYKTDWTSLSDILNFYLTKNSIVISFDPYEVGPYAEGTVEVEIFRWNMEELLFQDTETGNLLKNMYQNSH